MKGKAGLMACQRVSKESSEKVSKEKSAVTIFPLQKNCGFKKNLKWSWWLRENLLVLAPEHIPHRVLASKDVFGLQ